VPAVQEPGVHPSGVRGAVQPMSGRRVLGSVPRPAPRSMVRLWDGRWWPSAGRYGRVPVFRFGWAPSGLATVRQLAADGMRPGGQDPAGFLVWGPANRPRWAFLYRVDLAAAKRPMTPARWAAVSAMNAAQRVCPTCRTDVGYRIPRSLGECVDCSPACGGPAGRSETTGSVLAGGVPRQGKGGAVAA